MKVGEAMAGEKMLNMKGKQSVAGRIEGLKRTKLN